MHSNAAGFIIAKTWKQRKCPSPEKWIKKMWYIYTMEYYSAIKKNEIMLFAATWIDLNIIILSEVRERQIYHLQNLGKMIQMNLITRHKQTHRKQTSGYQWGNAGRDKLATGD